MYKSTNEQKSSSLSFLDKLDPLNKDHNLALKKYEKIKESFVEALFMQKYVNAIANWQTDKNDEFVFTP